MKISEVLVESKQLQEGPILNKIGTGVGKVAGTIGKAVGAAAGGVVGLGKAIKKGYQAGRDVVGMAGDKAKQPAQAGNQTPAQAAQPAAAQSAPAAQAAAPAQAATAAQADPTAAAPAQSTAAPPSTSQINKAGPKGAPMARAVQGAGAKQALARTTAATAQQAPDAAADTLYSQVKANVEKLDKKGKQRLLVLLQKSIAQHATRTKPAAAPGAAAQPAAAPATPTAPPAVGATAKPAPAGKKPVKIASKKKAPAAPAAPAAQPQTASIVHNGKVIAEGLSLFRKS